MLKALYFSLNIAFYKNFYLQVKEYFMYFLSKCNQTIKKSFTLIEVSLVLLIISILMVATLNGAKLYSSAKSQNIIQQVSDYQNAITNFYNQYGALPGDLYDTQYLLAPSDYKSYTMLQVGQQKANIRNTIPIGGNQDGKVSIDISTTNQMKYSEAVGVWAGLSAAKMLSGQFSSFCYETAKVENEICNSTGTCSSQSTTEVIPCFKQGINAPKIVYGKDDAVFIFYKPDEIQDKTLMGTVLTGSLQLSQIRDRHILMAVGTDTIKAYNQTTNLEGARLGGGAIEARVMQMIDNKIDDGKPYSGMVYGFNAGGENIAGQCNSSSSNYELKDYYTGNTTTREKIGYMTNKNGYCIGIFVSGEF